MNDQRRENLFKKIARLIPHRKRTDLKSALEKADDAKVQRLENVQFQGARFKKSFKSIIALFATAFGAILLVINMVFTMAVSPVYQRYSSFSKRINSEMQLTYSNTANNGLIAYGTSNLADERSSVVRASEVDTLFDEITNELFVGYEYSDFKALLADNSDKLTELAACRTEYNALKDDYFSDVNYVNNKSQNYLNYVVKLSIETDESKQQEYRDAINAYQEKRDSLTAKYNALIAKQGELEICLQKCTDSRQLMSNFIINNESAMADKLRVELYSNSTEIKNYGVLQYLKNCMQSLSNYYSAYTVEMDKYSADCTAYSDAEEKLAQLNADFDKKETYFQTATADFNGFIENFITATEQYYVALEAYDTDYNAFTADYNEFLDDYNKNYKDSSDDKKAEYDAAKTQYENKIKQFAQRKLEIEEIISYYENVLSTFGLSDYISSVKVKIKSTKEIEKLREALASETDSQKIAAINTQISDENKKIENAEKTIDKNQTKIALIYEILSTTVWTEEYYTTMCVEYKQIQTPTNEQKEEYELKKTTYETVQNALITLPARAAEKQNIFSQQVTISSLPHSISNDEYNSVVAYYNTEHALLKLQNVINMLPGLYGVAADSYQKIIENVGNVMNVNQKTHERLLTDLPLKETYASLLSYADSVQIISLDTLLFDDFDISALASDENHTVFAKDFYDKLKTEVSTFETAMATINSTAVKANQLSNDYYCCPNYLHMLLLVIDVVAAVIYASYFVYLILSALNEAKEENYERISKIINE